MHFKSRVLPYFFKWNVKYFCRPTRSSRTRGIQDSLIALIWVSRSVGFRPPLFNELMTVTLSGPFHKNLYTIFSICLMISCGVSNIVEKYKIFGIRDDFIMIALPNKDKPLKLHRLLGFWMSLNLSWKFCFMTSPWSHEKWIPSVLTPVHNSRHRGFSNEFLFAPIQIALVFEILIFKLEHFSREEDFYRRGVRQSSSHIISV